MSISTPDFTDTLHFYGSKTQTFRYRAYCEVQVGGNVYSANPSANADQQFLISVRIRDAGAIDVHVELDDRDGRLEIPAIGDAFSIVLGWQSESAVKVFQGYLTEIWHGFGRKHGGRRMWLVGSGMNALSNIKTPYKDHLGEQGSPTGQREGTQAYSFQTAASKFVGNSGSSIKVGATYANWTRDYWEMNHESAMNWVSRYADEFGAWSRIENNNFIFNGQADMTAPRLTAQWGDNLISWKIRPYAARPTWASGKQEWFDHVKGQWQQFQTSFNNNRFRGSPQATNALPTPAPNASVAQQQVLGLRELNNWQQGDGRIMINGEPNVTWGSLVTLVGARPGVDGTYMVSCAEHTYSRQGYVTMLEVTTAAQGAVPGTTGGIPLVPQPNPLTSPIPLGTSGATGTGFTPPAGPIGLQVGGVTVTDNSGNLIPGIWNETAVNDARLTALNTGNTDPLFGLSTSSGERAPPPIGAGP